MPATLNYINNINITKFMRNVRRVKPSKSFNTADIFIFDKLDRMVYNRSFDNPLPSFVDIFTVAISFIIFFLRDQ